MLSHQKHSKAHAGHKNKRATAKKHHKTHHAAIRTTQTRAFQSKIVNEKEPLNTTTGPVRVRFAPSPTGTLHLGGLRTALYNYLFTKNRGGECILRIEDTDRTRLVPGAMQSLINDMHWVGVQYDEGPDGIKKTPGASSNPNANPIDASPYIQSERFHLYQEAAQTLLDKGHAYHCFCTPERLDGLRTQRAAKGEPQIYDRLCAGLTADEVAERKTAGEKHVVRMKMPEGVSTSRDIVRGDVKFQNNLIDDQVLIKSDGFPTYHLANIVDDHMMKITHVIRGEEWLPSLPKHVALYNMLGWEAPQFAHLPLLLREDGGKLSKRFRDSSLDYYVEMGYLPEAIVNFVALLGWHPTVDEMQDHARRHGVEIKSDATTAAAGAAANKKGGEKVDLSKMDPALLKAMLTDDKTKLKQKTNQLASTVGGLNEVFTIDELAQYFNINNIQKSGATVELGKLNFFHSQHWKRALSEDIARLEAFAAPRVHTAIAAWQSEKQPIDGMEYTMLSNDPTAHDKDFGYATAYHRAAMNTTLSGEGEKYKPNASIIAALKTTRDHPCTLAEFPAKAMFIWARPNIENEKAVALKETLWNDTTEAKSTTNILKQLTQVIQDLPEEQIAEFDVTSVVDVLKKFSKTNKYALKEIYQPLRFCLSGRLEGVGVADQICSIGKGECLKRIQIALDLYGKKD